MDEVIEFIPYEVPNVGVVIAHDGDSYIVRTSDGRVVGFRSAGGIPTQESAASEIAFAIANPPPPPPPFEVSPWQMRRALNAAGLRSVVEAAVAAANQDTKDAWEVATTIRRDNPLLSGMAAQLGMTTTQIDDLFRLASSYV